MSRDYKNHSSFSGHDVALDVGLDQRKFIEQQSSTELYLHFSLELGRVRSDESKKVSG